jgi:flagellar biosynthesis/type III secretory pathway protein FliH
MADLDRYLRRFRRLVSPPGRPATAGAPSDREVGLRDELGDVFAAIDAVAREAEQLREDARHRAAQRRGEATDRAARIVADARDDADRERSEAAAAWRTRVERDLTVVEQEAVGQAADVRSRTDERLDDVAARVVDRLLSCEFEVVHGEAG